ncbi:phosphotransferase family protein [Gordonia sp. (in: high G+C Gram-positive bacteria)]|uniref:phosphotransferase family protein n=1 Tax=Gordonia sp. (in: high G+C Gram-positive bacteria) TaxID=84139 RepID=UPI003C78A391
MTVTDTHRMQTGLEEVLTEALGEGDAHVFELSRVPAGASRQTWSLRATTPAGTHDLILRLDLPGAREDSSLTREAALMSKAGAAGVPSPRVIADGIEHPGIGGDFIVMSRVDGETIPRKLLRDSQFAEARQVLPAQLGAALARLHTVDVSDLNDLPDGDELNVWRDELHRLDEPMPTFEYAVRWLEQHRPPSSRRTLVHGDFRNGNFIVGPEGLRAVLDWELAHVGDPLEDIGWLCVKAWRFGGDKPVGGFGNLDDLVTAYEASSGYRIDREALHWWQILGTLKWGIICVHQAQRHLSGAARSVELASIGRRVSENEWELLELLR